MNYSRKVDVWILDGCGKWNWRNWKIVVSDNIEQEPKDVQSASDVELHNDQSDDDKNMQDGDRNIFFDAFFTRSNILYCSFFVAFLSKDDLKTLKWFLHGRWFKKHQIVPFFFWKWFKTLKWFLHVRWLKNPLKCFCI